MSKKVLIIEDNPTDGMIVKGHLLDENMEVELAVNAKEGIAKALKMQPDLILLDILLPDGNGYDVCRQLKKELQLKNTIVIMHSIKDKPEDIMNAFHAGADDYIVKPPHPEFVAKKIRLYLRLR
ncbi:MAG: response regulator [Candidatus Omnitrophica bacterium]|nr:response regulator [Candidatus Omnitrophota bacterium]